MTSYPGTERETRVEHPVLLDVCARIFGACGMPDGDALLLADTLVFADVRGIHSHGTLRVPEYVAKLTDGGVDPRARPHVVREAGAALVVGGGNAIVQVACAFAMREAIARARGFGACVAAVRGSNHCGARS